MIQVVLLWLKATGLTLEWEVGHNVVGCERIQTFQMSAHPGMEGCWERFFQEGSHPTRRRVPELEMQDIFDIRTGFERYVLYSIRKDEEGAETLMRLQLFEKIEELLPGATENWAR